MAKPRKPKPSQSHTMGASPNSMQHLASRLATARNKQSVKKTYGDALR